MASKYNYLRATVNAGDGKRKWITAKTQEELDRKIKEAERQLEMGININDHTTVAQLTQLWYDTYKKPYLNVTSRKNLCAVIDCHILKGLGKMRVQKVKGPDIVNCMTKHGYNSKDSNRFLLSTLRSIFDLAMDLDMIVKNPVPRTLRVQGESREIEEPLTPEQTATLLENMKGKSGYLFTLIALSTGMRLSEIIALKWDCVDLSTSTIHVRRNCLRDESGKFIFTDVLKTPTSKRDIPIPLALHAVLATLPHKENDFVVQNSNGGPFTSAITGGINAQWKKALPGVKMHAHKMRHTYATRLIENGVLDLHEVSALLGHANIEVTMKVYTHYDKKSRAEETARKLQDSSYASALLGAVM